jgi:hypothetical protein
LSASELIGCSAQNDRGTVMGVASHVVAFMPFSQNSSTLR